MDMEVKHSGLHTNSDEEDNLRRSTKRVRSRVIYVENLLSDPEMMGKELPNPSFKDKLLSVQPLAGDQETMDWFLEEEDEDLEEEEDPCCPKLRLTREEKIRIRSSWRQTLIIKLLGRSIGYKTAIWKLKATIDLVAMNNGFFF